MPYWSGQFEKGNPVNYSLAQLYLFIPGSGTPWNFRFTSKLQKITFFFFLGAANIKPVLLERQLSSDPEMHVMAPEMNFKPTKLFHGWLLNKICLKISSFFYRFLVNLYSTSCIKYTENLKELNLPAKHVPGSFYKNQ